MAAKGRSLLGVGEGLAIVAVAGGGVTSCTVVLVGLGVIPSLKGTSSGPQLTSKPIVVIMTNANRLCLKYPPGIIGFVVVDIATKSGKVSSPHPVRSEPVDKDGRRTGFSFRSGLADGDTHNQEGPVMSRKRRTHLRGKRGQAFADQIRGISLDRILCVSIDVHKYFHVVTIHNALGEIMTPTFEIDIFQAGFDQLCQAIDEAIVRTKAQVVLTGMEPTGHYFENLARHLRQRPQPVTLINSYAVRKNRDQQMMHHEKDDEIDTASIGDLLRRGEGTPFKPASGVYLQLQHLDRVRLSKIKIRTMLQNQVLGHLDRIFPGLVIIAKEAKARYTPLFATDFWSCQTMQHLIRVCPNPRKLAAMPIRIKLITTSQVRATG